MASPAVLALMLSQLTFADPPPELLGRWRSLETSKGGIGAVVIFRANGVVDFSPGAVVDTTYRIEGKELVFPPPTANGPELRQKMDFTGADRLRLAEANWTRAGAAPDPGNLILGEWVGKREMDGRPMEARYLFYPGGKFLFLLPFRTPAPGRYSIQGSIMRLELPGRKPAEGPFKIDGDMLSTPSAGGSGYRFKRY
ncbi:MAG TPA: hypothetical protein VMT15_11735 [Bryobacteraceae bacterium]|nr:hypothetical protein [Bryobacteraceae bacterium]